MSCKIKYIEQEYRERNPEIADKLNQDFSDIFDQIKSNTELFSERGNKYTTKNIYLIKEPLNNFIESINKQYGVDNSTPIVVLRDTKDSRYKDVLVNVHPIAEKYFKNSDSLEINYEFAGVIIISNNLSKIKNWESNKSIDENTLWNKIRELGIPSNQIELIRNSKGNTVEEKLLDFVNQYSYTVEINIAKTNEEKQVIQRGDNEEFTFNGSIYEYKNGEYLKDDEIIDLIEYESAKHEAFSQPNTQYYSNLTVPGGTNYTENEITTPAITPSIKGHAQFATDNGIGWFRSDDKVDGGQWKEYNNITDENGEPVRGTVGGTPTKTRRILEVQSDLFQKGRDKKGLVSAREISYQQQKEWIKEGLTPEQMNERQNQMPSNQFLQLLNKDNNWVTFFIKAIIQDSAKKGYEKVLFPTSEVVSKIQKFDEAAEKYSNAISKLEKDRTDEDNFIISEWEKDSTKKTIKGTLDFYNNLRNTLDDLVGGNKNDRKKGIYKLQQITDEYGNTWNEVNISKELKNPIILRQKERALFKNLDNSNNKVLKKLMRIPSRSSIINSILEEYKNPSDDTMDMMNRKIEMMQNALDAIVLIDSSIEDSGQLLPANHPISKQYNKPVILINPEKAFSDTVFHEFGHLFIDLLGVNHPVVKQAIEFLKDSDLYEEISNRYPELEGENLDKEVLATALGIEADRVFKTDIEGMTMWQKIKEAILNLLSKLLGLNTNSIEKLAKEMLSGKTRLTGAEKFNTLVIQRSKYRLDSNEPNKQKAVIDLLNTFQKKVTKVEEAEGIERGYIDEESGEFFRDSVTTYTKKFLSDNHPNKGTFSIRFNREEITEENIEELINRNKIPYALASALDNYVLNRGIVSSPFNVNENEHNWYQVYNRIIAEEEGELSGVKEFNEALNVDNTFIFNIKRDLDYILEDAENIQKRNDQAPIAGSIIHKAIEDYIKEGTPFPRNIIDEDNKLFNEIKRIIDEGKKNGSVFRTEQILFSESKGLPGTADLLEITKDGKVRIYDFKTIKSLKNKDGKPKTDIALVKYKGYGHQLVTYGTILNEYGVELTDSNPYNILFAEINYSGTVSPESEIEVSDIKLIDLNNKYYHSELLLTQRQILREFASSQLLTELNLKSDIESLNDLTNELFQSLRTYEKLTKNMRTNLDTSYIRKLYADLKKNNKGTIDKYIATDNEIAIKSYIETIYNSLSVLESQKPQLGDIVDSNFLHNLEYVLQASEKLRDIDSFLRENPQVELLERDKIIKALNDTIALINANRDYYADKVKIGAINLLAENSNLMIGIQAELYELEFKKSDPNWKNLSKEEKQEKINRKLIQNDKLIKLKEYQFWKNQYENGMLDLRAIEMLFADPGMTKAQSVQIVKNMLDKADMAIRHKLMDIVPDIVKWNESLDHTNSPRERWGHLFVDEEYIDIYGKKQKVKTTRIIQETTSDYLEVVMKYQFQDNYYNKEIAKLKNKTTPLTKEERELLSNIEDKLEELRLKRKNEFSELFKKGKDKAYKQRSNPEYEKLSKKDKDFLNQVKYHLDAADNNLYDAPEKRLVRGFKDGNKVYYIPFARMTQAEAIKSGKYVDSYINKLKDYVRPAADEDEFNVSEDEYQNKPSVDIQNTEYYEIPVYYRNELEDLNLQSFDIPSLLVMNYETTINYREKKNIEADLFVIKESISSKNNNKIIKTNNFTNRVIESKVGGKVLSSENNRLYQAVKSSIDNRLYDRAYVGTYTSGANYSFIKGMEAMKEYSTILHLMGNFKSALTTATQGTFYRFIEGMVKENFTIEDFKKGTTKTYSDLDEMLKDTQRFAPESKTNLLIKKFGLENQLKSLANKFVQDNFAYKNMSKDTLYAVTSMAETIVTAQLMYSITSNIKVMNENGKYINKEGKEVTKDEAMSIDEAYEVVDGKLVLHKDVVYTSNNVNSKYFTNIEKDVTFAATELSSKIRSLYADLYGQYNQNLKSYVQRTVWGAAMMSLRTWLPRSLHRRWRGFSDIVSKDFMDFEELRKIENFDKRFYSQDQKRFQEGHYVTTLRLWRTIIKQMKENQMSLGSYFKIRKDIINTQMTDHEIANIKRTQIELALIALTGMLSMGLRALAKGLEDDDDSEKVYFAAYLMYRINDEISTFTNPFTLAKMVANPAVGLSTIERIGRFGYQLIGISYSEEDGWTPNAFEVYERGPKEGYNKALVKGLNLVPGFTNVNHLMSIMGYDSLYTIEDTYKNADRD